ncbi:TolC family protein [Ferrimonas pelagia]|uniref:TolC family protein n=1 Tax=Ferrimonas pelagia TaxID=1177826 RepID=A0ABP9FGS5_9GAMM
MKQHGYRRRLLAMLLSMGLIGPVSAESISLAQAWQQVDDSSALLAAERQVEARALAERRAAGALGGPSLSLGATYLNMEKPLGLDVNGLVPGLPISVPSLDLTEREIYRTSLRGSWPIYAGGRIQAAQAVKDAELDAQRQQVEIQRRERFNLLVQRYYGVLLAQRNAELREAQVSARRTHQRHADLLAEQGQIAEVERLNAQVAFDQARLGYASAQRQVQLAQQALDSLLQLNDSQPRAYRATTLALPEIAPLRRDMLSAHPALRLFDAKQRQAKGAIAAEKGRYKPELGLFGSYTLAEDSSVLSELEPEWFVGVRFTMPIVTNDGRSGRLQAARSAELEVRHRRAQTEQDLRLLLDSQYQAMEQAAFEYETYASSIALASENRRLRQLAFQQGLATSVELVDADQSLLAAQLGQAQAQYHYLTASAQVMTLAGQMTQFIERSGSLWQEIEQ